MRTRHSTQRQTGAVAIMTALALVLLIAVIGLVVDLGYLYTRKTELQNAADAAALAGARQLNGTAAGVTAAAAQAIALAAANSSDLGATPVAITNANIELGPAPDGPWSSVATASASNAAALNKFFIKVDTSGILQGSRPTWFMGVASAALANAGTFGFAVAGRTVCETLPIFTCIRTGGVAPDYGFIKGSSYRLAPPSGAGGGAIGPGNVGWMDPVPPGAPSLITGTNEMREVLCRGQGYCISPGTYTSLTEPALPETMSALNTRFASYSGTLNDAEHKLACPADTNIKKYIFDDAAGTGAPVDWLAATPLDKQSLDGGEEVVAGSPRIVHWSAARPGGGAIPTVSGGYPGVGSGASGEFTGTPYGQTAGSYFQAPPASLGGDPVASQAGRRIVTVGIASNCGTIIGSGSPVEIEAFGRFFMQRDGIGTGAPPTRGFYAEFLEMVPSPPIVLPEIRLYR